MQVILVQYYRTKLKAIGIVSERKAAEMAFDLFCTPFQARSKKASPAIFHKADKLSLEVQGHMVKGFRWSPAHPVNKTILICHGFHSNCYKFEKYISLFLKEGFTVLAFDAPGHGLSDGKLLHAVLYKEMILQVQHLYGPVQVMMAHSLGGLAASLASEEMPLLEKLVLIAPATETPSAIDNFCRILRLKIEIRKGMENIIEEMGNKPPGWYSVTRVVQNIKSSVLWIHDDADTICPYNDTKNIQEMQLPYLQFVTTKSLGHNRIYRDSKVQKMVTDFARV